MGFCALVVELRRRKVIRMNRKNRLKEFEDMVE
jgi:hypothetical protein